MLHKIAAIQQDITTLAIDAIVNAANQSLLGGGGVDGAIHRAAVSELLEYCRQLRGCQTGEAKITPGFKLPASYVIHTVGPVWQGGGHNEAVLLASCYQSSLELAIKHNIKNIAFPAISCGIYGYPLEEAANIALTAVGEFLSNENTIEKVFLCSFDDKMFSIYQGLLNY